MIAEFYKTKLFLVSIGAIPGALIRWQVDDIFIVNIIGCFLIGFFNTLLIPKKIKLFISFGFCGSLTSFSGWILNLFKLISNGLFIEIGADPRLEIPNQLGIKIDNETNEVAVNKLMETNIKGIFAAGDLTNASGPLKQTVTAAGQGAIAALSAYTFLGSK